MPAPFAFFELIPHVGHRQAFPATFPSIDAALAHFAGKVVEAEVSADGEACDVAVAIGASLSVYAIERVPA